MAKTRIQKFAEGLDRLRTVPRLLIGLYGWTFYEVTQWFMNLPAPLNSQSMFVSVIVGAGAAWFGLYVSSKPTVHEDDTKED